MLPLVHQLSGHVIVIHSDERRFLLINSIDAIAESTRNSLSHSLKSIYTENQSTLQPYTIDIFE